MRSPLFLILLALSSVACSPSDGSGAESPPTGDSAGAADTAPGRTGDYNETTAAGFDGDTGAFDFEENVDGPQGAVRTFRYAWPAAVSAERQLAGTLDRERRDILAQEKIEWEAALEGAPDGCVSCSNRSFEKEWKVVADIPGWLSLSADISTYTGGAHGNYTRQSLVWDRAAQESMPGLALFRSPVTLENALGARLCDALDRAREARRGAPVNREEGDSFNACPSLDEASVMIGSSTGEHFDRIGIYFGPYVAGSYAEGPYELNFPVTASVLDAVKPEFAGAFRVKR